jgi:hypothetical protein
MTKHYIVMHHSYTKAGATVSWDNIRDYHMSWRYNDSTVTKEQAEVLISQGKNVTPPWVNIGYHMGVERLQPGVIITQFGRDLADPGAHTIDFNTKGYGICLIGNFDKDDIHEDQWRAALQIVRGLMVKDLIPMERVIGHWETFILRGIAASQKDAQAIKSCPGRKFDMVKFRTELGAWKI